MLREKNRFRSGPKTVLMSMSLRPPSRCPVINSKICDRYRHRRSRSESLILLQCAQRASERELCGGDTCSGWRATVCASTRRHRHATSWKKRKREREGAGREGRVVCHARAPRAELAAALGRVDRARFQLISRQGCTDGERPRKTVA